MANVNPITLNTNIAGDARESQIYYLQENATNLGRLLDVYSAELQQLHTDNVIPLLYDRTINEADGVQLDNIGQLLDTDRSGLTDNQYRVLLRLVSFANQSNGRVNDLLDLIFFGVGDREAIYSKGFNYDIDIGFTICPDRSLTFQAGNPPFGFFGNTEARGYSTGPSPTGGQMSATVESGLTVNDIILERIVEALPVLTTYKIINKPQTFFGFRGNPHATGYSVSGNNSGGGLSSLLSTNRS